MADLTGVATPERRSRAPPRPPELPQHPDSYLFSPEYKRRAGGEGMTVHVAYGAFPGGAPCLLRMHVRSTMTLGDLKKDVAEQLKVLPQSLGDFAVDKCGLSDLTPINAIHLEPNDILYWEVSSVSYRKKGESPAESRARLRKLRQVTKEFAPRRSKADDFNELIHRTKRELTMSDAAFNAIKRVFEARAAQMTPLEAVQVIMDISRDYLSHEQAKELSDLFRGRFLDNGTRDHIGRRQEYMFWEWMDALNIYAPHQCAYFPGRHVGIAPQSDLIGSVSYPQHYYDLDWDKTYTYAEARPLIAKVLIGNMAQVAQAPICDALNERAALRSTALRGWARLIKLAPLIGRWSLYLKPIYLEVSLRPGGSAWADTRDHFDGMRAAPTAEEALETAKRQKI